MASAIAVTLEFTAVAEPQALVVRYTLENAGREDIGVFNRIQTVGVDGAIDFPPSAVYVDLEGGALHLRKMVLPAPEGLAMTVRPTPFVTRLSDRQRFVETFRLALPVAAVNPFRRAVLAASSPGAEVLADTPGHVDSIVLSIGVFAADPSIHFFPVSPAHPDVFRPWPPGPAVDRQIVLSKTVTLRAPLAVLDYRVVSAESRP